MDNQAEAALKVLSQQLQLHIKKYGWQFPDTKQCVQTLAAAGIATKQPTAVKEILTQALNELDAADPQNKTTCELLQQLIQALGAVE